MIAALLAFMLEPTPEAPHFGVNIVRVEAGTLSEVPITGGDHDRARLNCGEGVLSYSAERLSDGDTVQMMAGPVPLAGPFITHCTLRSAGGSDVLLVVYSGP